MTEREALKELFKLVEEGVLVRDTSHDDDLQIYLTQSNRLVVALLNAKNVLAKPEKTG